MSHACRQSARVLSQVFFNIFLVVHFLFASCLSVHTHRAALGSRFTTLRTFLRISSTIQYCFSSSLSLSVLLENERSHHVITHINYWPFHTHHVNNPSIHWPLLHFVGEKKKSTKRSQTNRQNYRRSPFSVFIYTHRKAGLGERERELRKEAIG